MAKREARVQQSTIGATTLPKVCVQVAVRNEEKVVEKTIRALCQLDWPRDRLEIVILDDSSVDRTVALARREATMWRARGINIRVITSAHRLTKGGLLREALSDTDADYFAVFDADYRPDPNFLKRMVVFLLDDPTLGFVQARLDFLNRNATWITRAQALDLDTYYAFDQVARNWADIPVAYNGTCGVWRRAAVEAAGGWSARSFLEDVDLSFRSFAKGWTGRFLTSVAVPGQLPETVSHFVRQRLRWSIGWHQQFSVLPIGSLLRTGWFRAFLFMLLFALDSSASLLVAVNAVLILVALVFSVPNSMLALTIFLSALIFVVVTRALGALLAVRYCGRRIDWQILSDLPKSWALQLIMLPVAARAAIAALLGAKLAFEQTPKSESEKIP